MRDCTELSALEQTELYNVLIQAAIAFAEKKGVALSAGNSNLYQEIETAVMRATTAKNT